MAGPELGVRRSAAQQQASISTGKVIAGLATWMAITAAAALSGLIAQWELRPPPVMVLVMVGFVVTIVLACGRFGKRVAMGVPVVGLIVFQSYRFPLELLLHRAYADGVMPVQMSYEGRNFDIATGIAALVIGGFYLATNKAVPRALAWAFNLGGLILLFNIVGIAVASTPVFTLFGPDKLNLWVAFFPFIWLPAIFVTLALFGHITLTRRLLADAKA